MIRNGTEYPSAVWKLHPKGRNMFSHRLLAQGNFAVSSLSSFEWPLWIFQCIADNPVPGWHSSSHSDTTDHWSQQLPEMGGDTTFPVCPQSFCVSETPWQQEAHANRDALWSNTYLALKKIGWQNQNHSRTLNVRQQKFPSPTYSPTKSIKFIVPLETGNQLLLPHRSAQVLILLSVAPLYKSCSTEAVKISLKKSTESRITFVCRK